MSELISRTEKEGKSMHVPLPGSPLWEARSLEDMADALRWMKDTLGISDKALDDLAGLTEGYANKLLGPTRYKNLGTTTLPLINGALAVKWVMMIDETQINCMSERWEQRNEERIRIENRKPSKELIERSKPHVLQQIGRAGGLKSASQPSHRLASQKGGKSRMRNLSKRERRELGKKAADARWAKSRASALTATGSLQHDG